MPSPFPGMDPYLELFEWEDFHTRSITIMCDLLSAQLPRGYVARVERRSYMEMGLDWESWESGERTLIPDVTVSQVATQTSPSISSAILAEPLHQRLADALEHREAFLEIRESKTRVVVTALEMLSPTNKRAGSIGGQLYAAKRRAVLESQTSFVEFDLLRSGQRILISEPGLPPDCDYYALVSRAELRPDVELFAWRLRDQMPVVSIPLKPGDGDLRLDLQEMITIAYQRADYAATLDYHRRLSPAVRPVDEQWLTEVLQKAVTPNSP